MTIRPDHHLEHRGYLGSVEVDVASNSLHGTVQGINDVVHYEADSPAELLDAFRGSVDDYLEWCEESGQAPEKPYSGKFNVRLGQDLHRRDGCGAACQPQ
jgi:predicted HicB family RNase H-like nuclease